MIRSIASLTILILLVSTGLLSCGNLNFDPQKSPDGFSPESISGLSFWLRADKKINVSSGLVADWTDAVASIQLNGPSGQGASYISTDGEFNGNPSVGFTGRTDGSLYDLSTFLASIPALCQPGYTVVMIMKPDLIATSFFSVFSIMNGTIKLLEAKFKYSSQGHRASFDLRHYAGPGSPTSLLGFAAEITPYASQVTIHGIRYEGGSTARVFRDGEFSIPTGNGGGSPDTVGCMGLSVNFGLNYTGIGNPPGINALKVAEIMIYDWALDDDSFRALGCYAKKKYGISNYLGSCN